MSEVIFCATDYYLQGGYGSYVDLFRLAELSGYKVIPLSQLDPQSNNTYIVTPLNDEWLQGWDNPKARIIHYELEWRIDWRANVNTPKGIAETWVADKAYAERIGARYVPMGSHSGLNETELSDTKHYDVSLISYQTDRRQLITRQLTAAHKLSIGGIENSWGEYRSNLLNKSRSMVHIHQREDTKGVAPLRWCLAAAHKLPLITEQVPDAGIFDARYMMQARYETLAYFTATMVHEWRILQEYSEALYQLLCIDYTFRKSVDSNV